MPSPTAPTAQRTGDAFRRVDWLELFFDLVFVVIVKQLTDLLHGDPGVDDFLLVAGILVLVWAAWLNVVTFVNMVGGTPGGARVPVLVSMAGVGLIAVSIPEVTGDGAPLFAIGYAVARVAIWPVWVRARRRSGRGALRPTLYGPGIAVLWLASIAVPDGYRLWVWAALVVAEMAIVATGLKGTRFIAGHLIERVGLFTMIVLGESLVELILAIDIGQSATAWIISALGFSIICSFWWLYFAAGAPVTERVLGRADAVDASDGVGAHATHVVAVLRDVLGVAHYVIVLGLIGVAAGLGGAIEQADGARLAFGTLVALCGGTALYHAAQVLIAWRYGLPMRLLLVWGVLSIAISAFVIAFGAGWAPWVVVTVMLVDTVLHLATGPLVARRVRTRT
ncbi:low temperature requirement protein A [Herbiconiux daphne]|uniref:Low temperature requirement protein A n=1 Tax=Herbiconiux daphne TaxID=2970914 RepID=A0ABT2H497_9MICO|nr:low temperature requirement protein A [Herbiconiux daphne]MCS5734742.1 low temperature requirement protein A [Herbiconiux daphne]